MVTSNNKTVIHKVIYHRLISVLITSAIAVSLATTANAMTYDSDDDSRGYFGIKAGIESIDDTSATTDSIDNPMLYGGIIGYKFNKNFAVEVDYSISSDADVTSKANGKGQYDITNYATYLAYFYPFADNFYAKSKLGIGGAEVDEAYTSGGNTSSDDIGIAGGLGLGYQLNKHVSVEGELGLLRSDNIDTNTLTIGTRYQF